MQEKNSNSKVKMLYHYCSTKTACEILKGKTLRMSDITKSNDYDEIYLFFPGILHAIYDEYKKNEFDFKYRQKRNIDAIEDLLCWEKTVIDELLSIGGLTSFVICFCEEGNLLSQWRGYADDAQGCSLGFSISDLQHYCEKENNLIKLTKVKYKSKKQMDNIIINDARRVLKVLKELRNDIVKEFKFINTEERIDSFVTIMFHKWICKIIIDSLQYKDSAYKEECEWRLYFNENVKGEKDLIFNEEEIDTLFNDELVKKLRNKIDFRITDISIVPFFPIDLFDISLKPIKEIYFGPKNMIKKMDFDLLCAKYGYKGIKVKYSDISYRG